MFCISLAHWMLNYNYILMYMIIINAVAQCVIYVDLLLAYCFSRFVGLAVALEHAWNWKIANGSSPVTHLK